MGGRGSGTWKRAEKKRTTGDSLSLDVRRLARDGLLARGIKGRISWAEVAREIHLACNGPEVLLLYEWQQPGGEWRKVCQPVPLSWTSCNYGGRRPWFVCRCGRRVAVLYGAGEHFLCRHCYGLAYDCQSEGVIDRAARKLGKINKCLRGDDSVECFATNRPKGMHKKTFSRLRKKAVPLESLISAVRNGRVSSLRSGK